MGKNPYKGRPIPKGRIEWAIKHARSASEASRLLNKSNRRGSNAHFLKN